MATELKKVTQLSWRRFLQTAEGIEGMLFLREQTPNIPKGQPHEVQYDAGKVEGFRFALDAIQDMIASQEKPQSNNFDNE